MISAIMLGVFSREERAVGEARRRALLDGEGDGKVPLA